jgi:hypothetical protein
MNQSHSMAEVEGSIRVRLRSSLRARTLGDTDIQMFAEMAGTKINKLVTTLFLICSQ